MVKNTLFSLLVACFLSISLHAHQVVASSVEGNKFEIKFWAHNGFEEYKPSQLLGANSYDENLNLIKTGISYNYADDSKKPEVLTEKKPSIITSFFDAGYWINTDNGYVVGDKTKVDGIVFDSLKSLKIGKTILSWSDKFINPIGLKLEVVPLQNPLSLKAGDNLAVLVLKDSKPLVNAGFETAKEELDVKTNEFGIALIPIKEAGLNIIAATYQENLLGDEKAQKLLIESSISFEIK